ILDPRSGENARGHVSAWVVHSSAAAADALSTAFIVMGPEEAERFCRDNPNIWAKLVEKSGAVRVYNPEALLLT
ncbi:MAG: FAD:protein FMN transferase, partial [Candidatus Aminicenantes bacterium]|nr:FAD:protein FMN transferase [Candidatus Aminicenantes bacterium]